MRLLCYSQCQFKIVLVRRRKIAENSEILFLPYFQYLRHFFVVEKRLRLAWKGSKIGLNKNEESLWKHKKEIISDKHSNF